MRKLWKQIVFCLMTALVVWTASLIWEKETLKDSLIRFHVVAASDSGEDQQVKLQVRDAVLAAIGQDLEAVANLHEARDYLSRELPKIRKIAEQTLRSAGFSETVQVSLCREAFEKRIYDTFSLPAGVYETLRIVIGEGEGHNWWCVAFPSLCLPATSSEFRETAAQSGIPDRTAEVLAEDGDYELRFFLLDKLGQLENILFGR